MITSEVVYRVADFVMICSVSIEVIGLLVAFAYSGIAVILNDPAFCLLGESLV